MPMDLDFAPLIDRIHDCRACGDLPLGPRPILQANPAAKILIIGQAPGRITHHKGIAFDDPSGDRLRAWLGIDRPTFYDETKLALIPMGFCFPGSGKNGDLPPRVECAEKWRRPLLKTLGDFDLTLIIGRYAIDWHAPEHAKATVTTAVASWQETWPSKLILPHPSPRNNRWLKQNPWFEAGVIPKLQQKVRQLIERDTL